MKSLVVILSLQYHQGDILFQVWVASQTRYDQDDQQMKSLEAVHA